MPIDKNERSYSQRELIARFERTGDQAFLVAARALGPIEVIAAPETRAIDENALVEIIDSASLSLSVIENGKVPQVGDPLAKYLSRDVRKAMSLPAKLGAPFKVDFWRLAYMKMRIDRDSTLDVRLAAKLAFPEIKGSMLDARIKSKWDTLEKNYREMVAVPTINCAMGLLCVLYTRSSFASQFEDPASFLPGVIQELIKTGVVSLSELQGMTGINLQN